MTFNELSTYTTIGTIVHVSVRFSSYILQMQILRMNIIHDYVLLWVKVVHVSSTLTNAVLTLTLIKQFDLFFILLFTTSL